MELAKKVLSKYSLSPIA